ncbi:MAG: hypothetical protein IPP31_09045 [Chitinophagaceae bacterium]|nr:hypothetical protein [Chitinophagaceae bacterium]
MEQLIASYLFLKKKCPLTGLGTLSINPSASITDFSNKLIYPPTPVIQFSGNETDTSELVEYLARRSGSSVDSAGERYQAFCQRIKTMASDNGLAPWKGVGVFQTDESGNTRFQPEALPAEYDQPVTANRVIHPEATHQILVGDKETTNVVMAEYFSEKPVARERWWIWALVLALAGMAVIAYYYYGIPFPHVGNAMSI